MGLTGIEPDSVSSLQHSNLQEMVKDGAAESGAVGSESCQYVSRLQEIIDAWPELPAEIQAEILETIRQNVID